MHEACRSLLLKLAGGGVCRLEPGEAAALTDLLEAGLVRKVEATRRMDLESRYEALQESHRRFLEARGCLERLDRRLAPRSRLGGLLSSGRPVSLGPEDPDLRRLEALLRDLDIQLPAREAAQDLPSRLERIRDRVLVDGRACLDRMALLDREIDTLQKTAPAGAQVEGEGCLALTEAGARTLPEASVLEDLESAYHAVAGSNRHRIDDYALFRDDPASLLSFILEALVQGDRPSRVVSDFEALADAFEHLAPFSDIRSMRVRNAFLMRLVRAYRDQPQAPYLWCNRERLLDLLARMSVLAPASVVASRWHLLYATDLLIAGPGDALSMQEGERRLMVFGAVQHRLTEQLAGVDVGDGQFLRLALAIHHEVLPRNIANPLVLDRTVSQIAEAAFEGMVHAPPDLGGPGSRLLFGYHLAHAARFVRARVDAMAQAFARAEAPFLGTEGRTVPIQVILHALVAQERVTQAGLDLAPEEYAGTFRRIRRHLQSHKGLVRALGSEQAMSDDEPFLAANLTAQAYIRRATLQLNATGAPRMPDVGMAGVYEAKSHRNAPLLGLPFGTLMLS
ncbi:MAG TPA: hypothetical protein VF768_03425 [Holophagaceae bacterium]